MTDSTDVLLMLWKDQREQVRQGEIQRAALTNIVIIVAAAGLGFVARRGRPDFDDLCVSVPMLLLGVYGSLTCWKYRERNSHHGSQMSRLYVAIADLHPSLELARIKSEGHARHDARFPRTVKIRLYALWMALHIGVALGGAALSAWILVSR
ncbi:hypothetical protein AB0I22_38885 [Streptomyces sp. NPDC050610]|uniref:hypothetical protein n=1 Tax=Streptomyces sp. NPDC050610 TaxID=3157097 RepID=UPI003448A43C